MGRVGAFAAWGFVGFLVLAGTGVLPPRLSERAESDAYYARVHIGLTHKGAPADIDFIVRCKDNVTRWRFGGSSHDPSPEKGPRVFVREIDGSHAVGTGVGSIPDGFDVCSGRTTQNGKVPKDWLPFVVWYDRAEDLSFGLGYLTQDAYERSDAELEFHEAFVERSTREAFEASLKTGPKNLMPPWASGFLTGQPPQLPTDLAPLIAEPWRAWRYDTFAGCHGVIRVPILPAMDELARSWRPVDNPRFWKPAGDKLFETFNIDRKLQAEYYSRANAWRDTKSYIRATKDDAKGEISDGNPPVAPLQPSRPQVFPAQIGYTLRALSAKPKTLDAIKSIDARLGDLKAERGIVYCEKTSPIKLFEEILKSEHIVASPNYFGPYQCKIDGKTLDYSRNCFEGQNIFIEDGEYFIIKIGITF